MFLNWYGFSKPCVTFNKVFFKLLPKNQKRFPTHSEKFSCQSWGVTWLYLKDFVLSVKQPFLLLPYFYFCLYPDTDIKIFYFLSPLLFIFNKFLDRSFRQILINYWSRKLVNKNNRKSLFLLLLLLLLILYFSLKNLHSLNSSNNYR